MLSLPKIAYLKF